MAVELSLTPVSVRVTGTRPLLVHRGGLANPLDPHAKAISEIAKKRNKTDADYAELARREWIGSLYYEDDIGPFIPAEMMEACIVAGGKKHKLGTAIKQAFQVEGDGRIPIEYTGPRKLAALEKEGDAFFLDSMVKVGMSKTTRRRPMFKKWGLTFDAVLDPTVLDKDQISLAIETAGRLVGLGDWRPRYGRFSAVVT